MQLNIRAGSARHIHIFLASNLDARLLIRSIASIPSFKFTLTTRMACDRSNTQRGRLSSVVQLMRAPLTLNNVIALVITISIHRACQESSLQDQPCSLMNTKSIFGVLAIFFAISTGHNILTVTRFHRIRRQVFGDSVCSARRRWQERKHISLSEEDVAARKNQFAEMFRRMPNLFISIVDVVLSTGFLGLYIITTLIAKAEEKVELGVAYASIGALVAL